MFYAEFKQRDSDNRIFITVEAPSIATAVALCEAYSWGCLAGGGNWLELENVTSSKPRGKTYFKFSDADAIRRGLKV